MVLSQKCYPFLYTTNYSKFGVVCGRRKLRVNVGKSKVMVCSREGGRAEMNVR